MDAPVTDDASSVSNTVENVRKDLGGQENSEVVDCEVKMVQAESKNNMGSETSEGNLKTPPTPDSNLTESVEGHGVQENISSEETDRMCELDFERILALENEQSAALILMLLSDDSIDILQLEKKSFKRVLESRLQSIRGIIKKVSRTDIAEAARNFGGTFFTRGDVVRFSHPRMFNDCACALYNTHPRYLLKNCSLKLLYERVRYQAVQSSELNDRCYIYVPDIYFDVIASRLADAIKHGLYSMSVTHPMLENPSLIDKVFQLLEKRTSVSSIFNRVKGKRGALFLFKTDEGRYLLQWVVEAQNLNLVERIVAAGYTISDREVIKGFYACSRVENSEVMRYLLRMYSQLLTPFQVKKAMTAATDHRNIEIVNLLLKHGALISDLSLDRQKNLFRASAEKENRKICEAVLSSVFGNNATIADKVHQLFRNTLPLRKICSTLLQVACRIGNVTLAELVFASSDDTIRDEHGRTPVMISAYNSRKEIFDFLVEKQADLNVIDKAGDSILHLASWVGCYSIVEKALPFLDINSQGRCKLTPLMNAVCQLQKEVYLLLMTKDPDITLTDIYGDTVFHIACQKGHLFIVNHLLSSFDLNIQDNSNWTPVMFAAQGGHKEVFDLLVSKGADLTLTDDCNNTVLHIACQGGAVYIVRQLLQLYDINIKGQHGWTPIMNAAVNGQGDVFHLLVTAGADLTLTDNCNDTLLHLACRGGNPSIFEHLSSSVDIDTRGNNGWTPIMNAAHKGKKELFELIMQKGCDITLIDDCGDSVLHHACHGGNVSIVQKLLPSFDINQTGNNGWTPIMYVAFDGLYDVFELLLSKEADLRISDKFGDSLLHLACLGGSVRIVEKVLPLFDINSRGQDGMTPVMNAAFKGFHEVFNLLVSNGADLTIKDDCGEHILHLACQGGNIEIVRQLLPSPDLDGRGWNGRTPVMNAAHKGTKDVFDLLVSEGADLSLIDERGDTILHHACEGGNIDVVKYTLSLFSVHMRGIFGQTPLMQAACYGHTEVFDYLLSLNAETTLADDGGDNILHLACESGKLCMVRRALTYCDINSRNGPGWTPAMVALINGQTDMFQYLKGEGADLTLVDNIGDNILTLARRGGCNEVIKQLFPSAEVMKATEKWTDCMKLLVYGLFSENDFQNNELDFTQRDMFGDTMLHLACRGGDVKAVQHILPYCDVNARGRYSWTPLMMAARCGHMEVFLFLRSNKADLLLVSDTGEDVFTLAQMGPHMNIIAHLLCLPEFKDRK